MMNNSNYVKSLQIIFTAIALGQLVFVFVIFLLQTERYFTLKVQLNPMHIIVPIVAFSAILISQVFFRQSVKLLKNKETTVLKLTGYRTVLIVKLAILEVAAIISILAFYSSGNQYFLLILTTLFFYFLAQFPSQQKVIVALELNEEDAISMKRMK